jgi:hypothetical protein
MLVWGFSLWSTCVGVQEGLAAVLCGPWRCREAKEALGIIWLACSDTPSARLCRLRSASSRHTFCSLLGGEGCRREGRTCGPRSPPSLRGRGELVFLCHTSCVTLSRERPIGPRPKCYVAESLSLDGLGHLLVPRPWLAS